jgi:hypothetical protein
MLALLALNSEKYFYALFSYGTEHLYEIQIEDLVRAPLKS